MRKAMSSVSRRHLCDGTVIIQGPHYLTEPVLAQSEIPAGGVMRLVNRFKTVNYFHLTDDFVGGTESWRRLVTARDGAIAVALHGDAAAAARLA
jgi:hypothetical protein